MREVVIVGRPNCGKTMFALNFAKYLGGKSVDVIVKNYDGLLDGCQTKTHLAQN